MKVPAIEALVEALRCFPGIGPKSARRIAYHLLERDREGARQVAAAITGALERVGHCSLCRNFSETPVCSLCQSPRREEGLLCVVEGPAEVAAIEETGEYRGRYFVLMGHLSPLDGIGPEAIGLDLLERRLAGGEIRELILATGTTAEGEATAHYIAQLGHRHGITVSRIAYGVPLGGELEFIDGGTLGLALASRRPVE